MVNFKTTNESKECYALILKKFDGTEYIFDTYMKTGHIKSALKSNGGLFYWDGKTGKRATVPHRIEKVKVTIEKIEDIVID